VQFASLSYIAPHSTSPRCGSGSETSQFLSLLSPSLSSSLSSSLCNYSQFYKKSLHPDSSYRRQLPQTFVFLTKHHAGMDPLPRIRCRVLLICLPSSIIMPPTPLTGQWCPTSTNKYNTRKRNPRRSISSKTLNKTTSGGTEHALPDRFFKNAEANMPRVDYEDFILFSQTDRHCFHTNNFFADVDASTTANQGSTHDGWNDDDFPPERNASQLEQCTPPSSHNSIYHPARDVPQRIDKAMDVVINDAAHSKYNDSEMPPPTPYMRPLELWEQTHERHESIAYRFEQLPRVVQQQRGGVHQL
jgi:hypothetical protein